MSSPGGTVTGRASTFDRGVGAAAEAIRLGVRPFAAPRSQPRTRRATDVVILVPSLLLLAYLVAVYPPSALELSLVRLLHSLPHWLEPMWSFLAYLTGLWAVAIFLTTLVARRISIAAQAIATLAVAIVVGVVVARLADGDWPNVVGALVDRTPDVDFPDVRLVAAVAVIGAASPHLVRPLRTLGRWVVVLGVVGTAASTTVTPGGALAALLIGVTAASIVNLVVGTSAGRPGLGEVAAALSALGVRTLDLAEEERQVAGVLRVRGTGSDGRPLLVKVYGRDAADNQLVARLWRAAWYRSEGPAIGSSRLHAVEREAFVTLLVGQGGVPTRDVVTAGETPDGNALLVLAGAATPLASLPPEAIDRDLVRRAWAALGHLGELRIAHQQIDPGTLVLVDGEIGFVELGGATVAPVEHQLEVDRSQLLAATAALAGTSTAVAAAVEALGPHALRSLLPYVQAAAFTTQLRRALKDAGVDADDLREAAAAAVEADPPELVNLRRVSPRAAIQVGLLALASYAILTAASGVDWDEVRTSVEDATWAWIVAGFLAAQLPRLTQAVSTSAPSRRSCPSAPCTGCSSPRAT